MPPDHLENIDAVGDGIKTGSFIPVVGGNGHLLAGKAREVAEENNLGIEVEVALQFVERERLEQAARVKHVTAVELSHARAEGDILHHGQTTVGQIARHGHAAAQRLAAEHARSLHDIGLAGQNRFKQVEHEFGSVLSVSVDNSKPAATEAQSFIEPALLRAAVAFVLRVVHHADGRVFGGKAVRDGAGLVGTGVVDNDKDAAATEKLGRNPLHRCRQHPRRLVGRHDNAEICGHENMSL